MTIGIDFDNTIVCYDELFHKVAVEQNAVPDSVAMNKVAVRDYLRLIGSEEIWTEMQGYVYGVRMGEAKMYEGVLDFILLAKSKGHDVVIISHKTRYPFLGHQYDLHASARKWISDNLVNKGKHLFDEGQFFFEETKESKLKRIGNCGCDIFIDDLPEILNNRLFPQNTQKVLFCPDAENAGNISLEEMTVMRTWTDISSKYF